MENIKYYLLALGIVIGMLGGYILFSPEDHHDKESEDIHENENEQSHTEDEITSVNLSADELKELGIELSEVESGEIEILTTLTGEIVLDPVKVSHLRPRYAGVVKKIFVDIGDNIKTGDTLAIIEANESLVTFPLISSVQGTVIDLHMSPGEIKGDNEHAIEIADLKYVWAEMTLYQENLNKIKTGMGAKVYDELSGNTYQGTISFISPIVDEQTRTTTARIKLNNNNRVWKPGMFVNAELKVRKRSADMLVDIDALQTYEGLTVVFVRDKFGFRPQPVSIGIQDSKYVEILSGLHIGDLYAAKGAFTIKAELMKASFGGGHSH